MHNIPLMRKIHLFLASNPHLHEQGKWAQCIAGWAVRLDGTYGLVYAGSGPMRDAVQCQDFRTGEWFDVEDMGRRLLGLTAEEAAGMFSAERRLALDWIGDIVAAHDTRVLDVLKSELAEVGA